jgi:alpha-beta hydrolase superfamily lysophospholipase
LLALGNLFTTVLQDLFIFRPVRLKKDHVYDFKLPYTEHFLNTPNNGKINLLWFKSQKEDQPLVFYCHGNSSNIQSWGEVAERYNARGFDTIIYDYRGFGKSQGKRNEQNFIEDARQVFKFALDHYGEEQIFIYGRSMGTSVATLLSSEYNPAALILETPYSSIPDLFQSYYPFLPSWLFSFKYTFPVKEWIKKTNCSVYIFQGTKDTVVPYQCAKKLKPLLKPEQNFITLPEGKHNDLKEFALFQEKTDQIFKQHYPQTDLP